MKDPSLWETVEHKAQGVVVQEKMQSKMLQMDSAESSAQEGHTNAVLQGVGQSAVLSLAQGSQLLSKKTLSTTLPFAQVGGKRVLC